MDGLFSSKPVKVEKLSTRKPAAQQTSNTWIDANGKVRINSDKIKEFVGEQTWEMGVDKGLRDWSRVRAALRNAKAEGVKLPETIPSYIKYKYRTFWGNEIRANYINYPPAIVETEEELEIKAKKLAFEKKQRQYDPHGVPQPSNPEAWSVERFAAFMESGNNTEAILLAFNSYNFRFLELVIEAGFNVNKKIDQYGKTLLHLAVSQGDVDKINYLLKVGADPRARDVKGNTPLHLSLNQPFGFHPTVIATSLIDYGADIIAR